MIGTYPVTIQLLRSMKNLIKKRKIWKTNGVTIKLNTCIKIWTFHSLNDDRRSCVFIDTPLEKNIVATAMYFTVMCGNNGPET